MTRITAELMQMNLSGTTVILVVGVALVMIVAIILLLVRSGAGRREREARMRARLIEMEREAQFTAAADRVPHSRHAGDVASHVSALFKEHLSIPVLAVYARHECDSQFINVLQRDQTHASSPSDLPAAIPATVWPKDGQVSAQSIASIIGSAHGSASMSEVSAVAEEPAPADEENLEPERITESLEPLEPERQVQASPVEDVLLIPWNSMFQWNGLIVASLPAGTTADAIEPHRDAIARLTERLAVALEFEAVDFALEAIEQRAQRTASFSHSLISCLEEPSPLNAIVREVTKLVNSDSAALWRLDEATSMISMVASEGLRSAEFLPLPLGQGLAGNIASSGDALAIEDAPSDPRCIFPREARESGIVSYLGVPLMADGKTLGVIEAHSATGRAWTENDHRALESAATIIAELIKSTETRGNRLRIESAYLGLSEALQRLRSAEEVKEAVVEVLGHALGASRVVTVEFNEEGQTQPVKQEHLQPPAKSALGATFRESLVARVASQTSPDPIPIADSREQSLMGPEQSTDLGVLSELALPIRVNGKTRSIVYVHQCDRTREWDREEVEFAERVVRQLSLSLSNLIALEQAFKDAEQARAELKQATANANSAQVTELEQKIQSLERVLEHSRGLEEQARGMLAKASALETKSRAEADVARHAEAEMRREFQSVDEDRKRMQNSAQQLLEINRLKSEFIVNAGREIEGSLQSVLGVAELMARGSYGALSPEQLEALNGLYGSARRIKNDVDWLIEYGSTRSRRLEPSEEK
jgi:GAF domain-containing protein